IAYIWDFSDGSKSGGVVNAHSWSEPGVYTVILTVRDDDYLIDHAYLNITVVKGTNRPIINGIVPNQVKVEDAPPWELDLSTYGSDFDGLTEDLRWHLTGENTSLYHVLGENSTEQKLIFSPILNAFGNDSVTLWLTDKDGHNTTQQLCINITPINDRPTIESLPNLVVHYNVPYTFNLTNYISDVETLRHLLTLSAQDQYTNNYVTVKQHTITFLYPEELMDEILLTTVSVSDGDLDSMEIMSITVSGNWPPILKTKLPDVVLTEGITKHDVFKLDDYFTDPEDEKLYFSHTESFVKIYIKQNHSVDMIPQGDWTGDEDVIFRARDPVGGISEDTIKITVKPINDPPEIGNVPNLHVHYDMDYYFDISYYISDNDHKLSELTLKVSDNDHIRISPQNNLGIILNYPKVMLGNTTQVLLTVSDGLIETSKTISVTVIEGFPPELIQKLPDIVFNEDEELIEFFDLDEYFLDLDEDSLFYTTGNEMVNITIDTEHLVSFNTPRDWFGMEEVAFRATDPVGALVEDSILVSVLPMNDAPILAPLPKITLNETEIFRLNLELYITDVDTNISDIIIHVEDSNIIVSGTTLVIFGSPDLPDEVDIHLIDGNETVNGKLPIKVIIEQKSTSALSSTITGFVIILIIIIVLILLILGYYYRLGRKYDIEEIFLIHNSGKLLS
ncbi:MAG: hypothetical protein KAJ51_00945, partial [Thermoplasmata archaeon]|nr:hypothetical protein [Thermoplasmata archaeon]